MQLIPLLLLSLFSQSLCLLLILSFQASVIPFTSAPLVIPFTHPSIIEFSCAPSSLSSVLQLAHPSLMSVSLTAVKLNIFHLTSDEALLCHVFIYTLR